MSAGEQGSRSNGVGSAGLVQGALGPSVPRAAGDAALPAGGTGKPDSGASIASDDRAVTDARRSDPAAATAATAEEFAPIAGTRVATHADAEVHDQQGLSLASELDFRRFALGQNFGAAAVVKKHIITVPVRKPQRQEFIRVHPSAEWRLTVAVLPLKEERETYLVPQELHEALGPEIVLTTLYTALNRQNVVFLWPVRLPGPDGRLDEWNRSAHEAANLAMRAWTKVAANMSLGAYELSEAMGELADPEWPDVGFRRLVTIAFREKIIDRLDHPVLRRLRGEI